MIKKYIVNVSKIGILVLLFFFILGMSAEYYTDSVDHYYQERSHQEPFVVPSTKGNGMGLDYIYQLPHIRDKKIVVFGASTSLVGLNEDGLNSQYQLLKACSGSATIYSYQVMKNYLEEEKYSFHDDDIIKIDISPVTFKKNTLNNEVIVSALEYASLYEVDDHLAVTRQPFFYVSQFFGLNARKIQKAFEYFSEYCQHGNYDRLFLTSQNDWEGYDKLLSFDQGRKRRIEQFILSYAKNHVVVDLLYMHSSLEESLAGQEFNQYVDEELIPFLKENHIAFIDSRHVIEDQYYIDRTHLNSEGCQIYTQYVDKALRNIWGGLYE